MVSLPTTMNVSNSAMCGEDFVSVMTQMESDLPARDFVEAALKKRLEVDLG
jgi:hypothetical protein